jgi:hypothetical protein
LGFAVLTIRGLITGADFEGTLKWALAAAALFFPLGLVIGDLARKLAEDNAHSEFSRLQTTPTE